MIDTQIQSLEFAMKWKEEEGADRQKHSHVGKPKTVPREGGFYSGIGGISRKTIFFSKKQNKNTR